MDLHDKKQPYDEHDDLEEELLEEETDDILDDEEYQEDDEEAEEESAVKDDGASQPKKQKNLGVYLAMALCLVALGVGAWATYDTVVKISDVTQDTASSSAPLDTPKASASGSATAATVMPLSRSAVSDFALYP